MDSSDVIYMIAFLFSASFGCYYRTIRDKELKKNVGTLAGLVMTVILSGVHSLHMLITVSINTIIITKMKRHCHFVSFIFSFSYLVFFRCSSYLGLPAPGVHTNLIQMILTFKVVGLALEVNSAPEQNPEGTGKIEVSCVDIFHYCFNYVGLLAGPYFKYRTFIDYFNYPFGEHARWKRPAFDQLKYIPLYGLVFVVVNSIWPASYMATEEFYQRSWLYRYCYMWPMLVLLMTRMFIGLLLSNVGCITAGFGAYPGFTNPKPGLGPSEKFSEMRSLLANEATLPTVEYSFETTSSICVYDVMVCTTCRDLARNWNSCVQYWLVANVYQTFPYRNHRTLATVLVSTIWHGGSIGYYLSVAILPLFFVIEDIYRELYTKKAEEKFPKICEWAHRVYKFHSFAYLVVPFSTRRVDVIIKYYNSINHFSSIVAIMMYVLGQILLNAKPTKGKKIK